ncbi:Exosome complex component RRP42 [Kluyveromyces marxianus]|nr:Exosome complex component rrp42 [Kluyveromyces marxianus]KAG0682366.1 Exosome complex component rrp42 [Kluyveromyces marxianus]
MSLSIAEKSFLYDSLALNPPLRPDGRALHQFRPVEVSTDFLPNSNGSSRVILSGGSECIVSVKAKVVDHTVESELLVVEVDIQGHRDDSPLVQSMSSLLSKLLKQTINSDKLMLTKRYSFKLFIDVLVLASKSYPVSMISFAIFSALKNTWLPKLISNDDDLEVEELPTFHDYDMVKLEADAPLLFTFAIVGDNVLVDPTYEESLVSNNGLVVTWYQNEVRSPIRSVGLNDDSTKGFKQAHLEKAFKVIRQYAPDVEKALESSN